MKQITITTAKAQILIVDLPLETTFAEIVDEKISEGVIYSGYHLRHHDRSGYSYFIKLPEGSWQLLGKALELTEEQARKIVDYHSYDSEPRFIKFESLLSANGVLLSNPLGMFRPVLIVDHGAGQIKSSIQIEAWDAAEEKVWRNPYVLIKTKP